MLETIKRPNTDSDRTLEELNTAIEQAYSTLEERSPEWEFIGETEGQAGRIHRYYRNGEEYLYTTHFVTGRGVITEEEHVFGRKIPSRYRGRIKQW